MGYRSPGEVMVREIEAPSLPNDSNIRETAPVREQPLVQSPTSEKDRDDWMNSLSIMRDRASDGSSSVLPALELTFEQPASDQHKGDDDPGSPDTSVEVNGVDSSAPLHSYGYLASVDKVGTELKEKLNKGEIGEGNLGVQQQYLAELQAVTASAIAGDAASFVSLANSGFASQGLEQVSIYDLKMQKGSDGQVLLVAPLGANRGDNALSHQDGVALVRGDGRPVSAMELGQYLRADGTILISEQGQALRTGDDLAMSPADVEQTSKSASESGFAERSLALEQNELNSISTAVLNGINETKEKFSVVRDSILQTGSSEAQIASSREEVSQNVDLSTEAKQAADAQKTVKTRLGETLRSIALRDLNDVKNWQLLAEKNNLSTDTDSKGNPLAVLQRGMILTLPSAAEIADFQARASLAASLQLT